MRSILHGFSIIKMGLGVLQQKRKPICYTWDQAVGLTRSDLQVKLEMVLKENSTNNGCFFFFIALHGDMSLIFIRSSLWGWNCDSTLPWIRDQVNHPALLRKVREGLGEWQHPLLAFSDYITNNFICQTTTINVNVRIVLCGLLLSTSRVYFLPLI